MRSYLHGAPPVAFVDDDQVEEVGRELAEEVTLFVRAGDRLVQREIDLEALVHLAVRDLGHRPRERLEVVRLGLVDQDVAVGEEENPLLHSGFPEAPDDLEGRHRLAGARRHDEQDSVLLLGDGLDDAIDGVDLVVAGRPTAPVGVVVLGDDRLGGRRQRLPGRVPPPEFCWRWELVESELLLDGADDRPVRSWSDEAVAVRRKHEGHVQHVGVAEALLHPVANAVVVVLRLDDRQRNVGVRLEVQDVVRELRCPSRDKPAAHDDASLGEVDVLPNLRLDVPAGLDDRGRDELGADVPFGQGALVHRTPRVSRHLGQALGKQRHRGFEAVMLATGGAVANYFPTRGLKANVRPCTNTPTKLK